MIDEWGFGIWFCERCGEPFVSESDIYTVRDSLSDELIEVCSRCYKK